MVKTKGDTRIKFKHSTESKREMDTLPVVEDYQVTALWGLTTAQKLLWFYIRSEGQRQYSVRQLALALELSTATVSSGLKELTARGLIEEVEPGRGSRAAVVRAKVPRLI
jgi:DNA-binding MarR family transcriptional regulator